MEQKLIHTPDGVRDVYGTELRAKKNTEKKIIERFRMYGYKEIETPAFEYFDIFSNEIGTTPSRELYKFFDKEGDTLVLSPLCTHMFSTWMKCDTYMRAIFDSVVHPRLFSDWRERLCSYSDTFLLYLGKTILACSSKL